ncbi:MAG TPA: hypothetical protein VGZ22_27710 [Isosphaeraceae bacterium]|jgi:hypothetical protein|nr:hypothetical protein [Isosphaeraceae bacterium]
MGRDPKEGKAGRLDLAPSAWPVGARVAVSAALLFHIIAILAAALSVPPASMLERTVAEQFIHYYELIDQGHGYRYYAPEPPPTPVVIARLEFADGRPEAQVRLPDRALRPRLRYQRHLALANHLYVEFSSAPRDEQGQRRSRWAESYARHLCKTRGCSRVSIAVRMHLIPDPAQVSEMLREGAAVVDLDADEFYTAPERIGEYSCDAF